METKNESMNDIKTADLRQLTKTDARRDTMLWVDEFMNTVQVSNLNDDIRASDEFYSKAKQFCFDLVMKIFDIDNYLSSNSELLKLHEETGKEPRIGFATLFQVYTNYFSEHEIGNTHDNMLNHITMKQQELADVFCKRLQVWYEKGFQPNDKISCTGSGKPSNVAIIHKALYELSFLFNHLLNHIDIEYKQISKRKSEDLLGKDGLKEHQTEPLEVAFGYSKNLTEVSKREAYDGSAIWANKAKEIIMAEIENGEEDILSYEAIALDYCEALVKSIFGVGDLKLADIPYIKLDYQNGTDVFAVNDSAQWILLNFSSAKINDWIVNAEFYEQAQKTQNMIAQQLLNRLKVWLHDSSNNDKTVKFLNDYSQSKNLLIINMALSEMTEFVNHLYNNHFDLNEQGSLEMGTATAIHNKRDLFQKTKGVDYVNSKMGFGQNGFFDENADDA